MIKHNFSSQEHSLLPLSGPLTWKVCLYTGRQRCRKVRKFDRKQLIYQQEAIINRENVHSLILLISYLWQRAPSLYRREPVKRCHAVRFWPFAHLLCCAPPGNTQIFLDTSIRLSVNIYQAWCVCEERSLYKFVIYIVSAYPCACWGVYWFWMSTWATCATLTNGILIFWIKYLCVKLDLSWREVTF